MHGAGDKRVAELLRARLAEGPADVLELLVHLRRAAPAVLARQEGAIHAHLHDGIRRDRLVLAGRSTRGLVRYALPDSPPEDAGGAEGPWPGALPAARSATALAVAKGVRDEADRGRVVRDVAAHLAALEEVGGVAAFGSRRLARSLVHRADRGRRLVAFATGGGDRLRRVLFHEGPWILGVVATYFLLRTFVVNVYVIPSDSMRTCLEPADRVAVLRFGGPERWRIFVFEGEGKMVVKRIVGLGGESIAVHQGDVFVDDELLVKPDGVRESLARPAKTWEAREGTLLDWDRVPGDGVDGWTCRNWPLHGDAWIGIERKAIHAPAVPLFDGTLELDVERPAGGDVAIRLSRGLLDTPEYEGAVAFELVAHDEGLLLGARVGPNPMRVLAEHKTPLPAGRIRLSLGYVDGHVRAAGPGWSHVAAHAAPYHRLGARLETRGAIRFHGARFVPDIHYSGDGELGVPTRGAGPARRVPFAIPKGHVFFLGDNTRNSQDSRDPAVGAISEDRLVGPVVLRIWPPSRLSRPR